MTRCTLTCLLVLLFATALHAQEQDITVDGPANIKIDNSGIHVTSTTQPAGKPGAAPTTRPGQIRIRMSNNKFENNGPPTETKPLPASEAGQPAENPFKAIKPAGLAIFKKRNVDIDAIQKMKAVLITGTYTGSKRREIVNDDPNLIVILGKGFITHGSVTSRGPILAVDDAHFMGNVKGESIVWFTGESQPRGETVGSPVICGPKVYMRQAKWTGDEVWVGTYGME